MKKLFLIVCSLAVTGCATTQITAETPLEPDEGIVAAHYTCDDGMIRLDLMPKGTGDENPGRGWMLAEMEAVSKRGGHMFCGKEPLVTLKMKEGEYFFGDVVAFGSITTFAEEDAYKFRIEKGKVNYIGDVKANATRPFFLIPVELQTIEVGISIEDHSNNMISSLEEKVPDLLQKYPYRNATAKK